MEKVKMDIELLLRWAYVDELSKRQCSAAEGIWDKIQDFTNHGGVDSGRGAAQRYAHFGLPDPDAERIEKAVSALSETVIDWREHFGAIAGDLAGLITINDLLPLDRRGPRTPDVGWGKAGTKALKAFFGDKGAAPIVDRPRDVLLVGGIKTNILIMAHAIKGTRPEWRDEDPTPAMTPSHGRGGTTAKIIGECRGKNLYSTGSCCPLTWSPSPLSVVTSRSDYFAWHQALTKLSADLQLEKFQPLPPNASATPWIENDEWVSRIIPVKYGYVGPIRTLPLKPKRPAAGPPPYRGISRVKRVEPEAM
jgi:hypothetical protein